MYGEFFENSGFDPGGLHGGGDETAGASGQSQASAAPEEVSALRLPPVGEEEAWLAAFVLERGEVAVVRALLRVVPARRILSIVETLCKQEFGDESVVVYDSGQARTLGPDSCAAFAPPHTHTRTHACTRTYTRDTHDTHTHTHSLSHTHTH